jgi:hypothetical protein
MPKRLRRQPRNREEYGSPGSSCCQRGSTPKSGSDRTKDRCQQRSGMNSAGWVSFTSAKWVKIQSALTVGTYQARCHAGYRRRTVAVPTRCQGRHVWTSASCPNHADDQGTFVFRPVASATCHWNLAYPNEHCWHGSEVAVSLAGRPKLLLTLATTHPAMVREAFGMEAQD